jgi:hypothetical protein
MKNVSILNFRNNYSRVNTKKQKEKTIVNIILTILGLDIVVHILLFCSKKAMFYAVAHYHYYLGIYLLYMFAGAGLAWITVDVMTDITIKISRIKFNKLRFWK